jgi:hypothetical protein
LWAFEKEPLRLKNEQASFYGAFAIPGQFSQPAAALPNSERVFGVDRVGELESYGSLSWSEL